MRSMSLILLGVQVTLFGVLLFVVFALGGPAHAQEEVVEEPPVDPVLDEDLHPKERTKVLADLGDFSVTPVVANEKVKPRDIVKKELVLTNNTDRRLHLYITVENIDPADGAQDFAAPAVSDLSTSLANWIEITRGKIDLGPQESRKIPYLIHVNLSAAPGSYFAQIGINKGADRAYDEGVEDDATLMLSVEVLDDAHERLSLGNFTSDNSVVLGESIGFSYLLENVGNRDVEPRGSIRIFNRRGEEVGSVPLNADGAEITPENKRQLAAAWSAQGRFGKYKAFLDLEYGENQLASVQDTLYFWVFPWKEILAALVGVILLGIFGTFIIHMRTVARPVPVRSQSHVPSADPEPTYDPTSTSMPTYSQPSTGGPTILAGRAKRAPGTHVPIPGQQQEQMQVAPRGRGHAAVSGNTVQLAPRR